MLRGHTYWLLSVAISADGSRVVTVVPHQLVKVWDAETGACLCLLRGRTRYDAVVAMSADGARVMTVSEGNVGICDTPTFPRHALTFSLEGPPSPWRQLPRQGARPGDRAADRGALCRSVLGQVAEWDGAGWRRMHMIRGTRMLMMMRLHARQQAMRTGKHKVLYDLFSHTLQYSTNHPSARPLTRRRCAAGVFAARAPRPAGAARPTSRPCPFRATQAGPPCAGSAS